MVHGLLTSPCMSLALLWVYVLSISCLATPHCGSRVQVVSQVAMATGHRALTSSPWWPSVVPSSWQGSGQGLEFLRNPILSPGCATLCGWGQAGDQEVGPGCWKRHDIQNRKECAFLLVLISRNQGMLQHPSPELFFPIIKTLVQASFFLAKISNFILFFQMY